MRSYIARILPLMAICAAALAAPLSCQEPSEEPAVIKALRAKLKVQYRQLLDALAKNAINMRRDDLRDLIQKHKIIDSSVHRFADQTIATMLDPFAIGIDYVRFVAAVAPGLTGRIVRVEKNRRQTVLTKAQLLPGHLVILEPGNYLLPNDAQLRDLLIIGAGRGKTTLRGQVDSAERLQVESLTWECDNSPCLDLDRGGSAHLVDCLVRGYNSGRGGSNAIFGIDSILLIEDCTFEGMSGDQDKPDSQGGDAFDLRLDNFLYVRNTKFKDNDEVVRAGSVCTFDNCSSTHRQGREKGITPQAGGTVLLRKNRVALSTETGTRDFVHATDDQEVINHLTRPQSELEPETRQAINTLGLRKSLRYWTTLLQHTNRSVRSSAKKHMQAVLRVSPPVSKTDRKLLAKLPSALRARIVTALQTSRSLHWLDGVDDAYEWDAQHGYYVPKKQR